MTELIDSNDSSLVQQQEGSPGTSQNNSTSTTMMTAADLFTMSSQSVQTQTPIEYYIAEQLTRAQVDVQEMRKHCSRLNGSLVSLSRSQELQKQEIEALQVSIARVKTENTKRIRELSDRINTLEKAVPLFSRRTLSDRDGSVRCVML